jgi:nickel-dependent lactate racemase
VQRLDGESIRRSTEKRNIIVMINKIKDGFQGNKRYEKKWLHGHPVKDEYKRVCVKGESEFHLSMITKNVTHGMQTEIK